MAKAFLEIPNASQNYVPPPSTLVVGLAEAVGVILIYTTNLENGKQSVMEKKQSLLKQTQKKLSDGKAINPINVVIESKNQDVVSIKNFDQRPRNNIRLPFGFNGQNKGLKAKRTSIFCIADLSRNDLQDLC